MLLSELSFEGVRGFSASGRVALTPGYWVLKPPSPVSPELGAFLTALFYPDGRGGDRGFALEGAAEPSVSVQLQTDAFIYRLARTLGSGGALYQRPATGGDEEMVTEDAQEVIQVIRAAGLPARTTFEECFTLSFDQLPTRRGVRKKQGSSGGAEKLVGLQKELEMSREVDNLQQKVDGLNREMDDLERKFTKVEAMQQMVAEAQRAYESAPTAQSLGLPEDIVERCQKYPQWMAKRDEALARLSGEPVVPQAAKKVCQACGKVHKEGEHGDHPKIIEKPKVQVPSVFADGAFWAGIAVGAVGFAVSTWVGGIAHYVALANIPAFGFSAFKALQYVDALQADYNEQMKMKAAANIEKKIKTDFEVLAAPVEAALKKADVGSPEELIELLGQAETLRGRWEELNGQLEPVMADPAYQSAFERRAALQEELSQASAVLAEKGAYVRDSSELTAEIHKLKASMVAEQEKALAMEKAGAQAPLEDPTPGLLAHAADIFVCDITAASALLKDRCTQYLAALTDKRYSGLVFAKDGRAGLLRGTETVAAAKIPPVDLDLYYLAMRLTLVEKASARVKVPFILDEPFNTVPPPKLQLLARMLKHLGTLTQVLHTTTNGGFGTVADGQIAI